jgi:hypothetical protein
MKNAYKILVGKPEWKSRLGDLGVDEIKINPKRNRVSGGWIHLGQDKDQWRALVNTVMNCRVAGNFLTS